MIKDYLIEVFEPTLLFGLLCSLVGLSAAIYYDNARIFLGILAILGIILAQIAVNLIDDYVDYNIGIDKETVKTKFSGGSILVANKKVTTKSILIIAIIMLSLTGIMGLYILSFLSVFAFNLIIILILFGGVAILLYARYLTHIPYFSEPFVTLSFALVGLGVFIVATNAAANFYLILLFACIPSGLQVGVAMIANELPDRKTDKKYGRRNTIIMFSDTKKASGLYFFFQFVGYFLIGCGIVEKVLPITFLIVFAVIPIMYVIGAGIENYKSPKTHETIMGLNAFAAFLYIFLISVAFII